MKKTIVLLVLMATVLCVRSQKTTPGYYFYDGTKMEIPVSTTSALVYFNKANISLDEINSAYTVEKEVLLDSKKAELLYAFQIGIGSDNYEAALTELKGKPYVYDVEPVIGEEGYTMVSSTFYVLLNNRSDTSVLKTMAEQTMATYEGALFDKDDLGLMWYGLSTNKSTYNALEMSAIYGESGLFKAVDPGFIYTVRQNTLTDAMLSYQWHLGDDGDLFDDIWLDSILGNDIKVAIIDDGVDVTHNEFAGLTTIASADFSGDNMTYPASVNGSHATKVAGVIFANHNQYDIAGIAPKAKLINVSVMNPNFSSPQNYLDNDIVIKLASAIKYADTSAADIILCPWDFITGTNVPTYSSVLETRIDGALSNGRGGKGSVVIFSSGNKNGTSKDISYPANYDDRLIVVGASMTNNRRWGQSCYGDELDVVAPGKDIWTTTTDINGDHDLEEISGTSMSAAYAAGVAALMLSANPNLTRSQIDWILKATAYKHYYYTFGTYSNHPSGTWNNEVGYGRVNPCRAVEMAKNISLTPNVVVKDTANDNGVEPTSISLPFNSPSIVAKDALNLMLAPMVTPGNSYKINVTLHNYSPSSVMVNPSDVKLYYKINTSESGLKWGSSFSSFTPLTPSSTTPVTITGNGGSHTFVIPVSFSPGIPESYVGNTMYITFMTIIGDDTDLLHDFGETNVTLKQFVSENRLVAAKRYLHYDDNPSLPVDPNIPKGVGINITPNPTSGMATIDVIADEIPATAMIVVTDMYGNLVLTERLNGSNYRLNLEEKPTGTYYIFIVANNQVLGMNNVVIY